MSKTQDRLKQVARDLETAYSKYNEQDYAMAIKYMRLAQYGFTQAIKSCRLKQREQREAERVVRKANRTAMTQRERCGGSVEEGARHVSG